VVVPFLNQTKLQEEVKKFTDINVLVVSQLRSWKEQDFIDEKITRGVWKEIVEKLQLNTGELQRVIQERDNARQQLEQAKIIFAPYIQAEEALLSTNYRFSSAVDKSSHGAVVEAIVMTTRKHVVVKLFYDLAKAKHEEHLLMYLDGKHCTIFLLDSFPLTHFYSYALVFKKYNMCKNYNQNNIKHWMWQLLEAVEYCHSKKVLHRDISPGNIFSCTKGTHNVLADFGLAILAEEKININETAGTMPYMAPEVIWCSGKSNYSFPADIWSVGVVYAEMLIRQRLFPTDFIEYAAAYTSFSDNRMAYIRQKKNNLDSTAIDLLLKLLETEPHQRITAQQAQQHLYFQTPD